jgi:hypothetical protein
MSDIVKRARGYLAENAAESGADVLIDDLVTELDLARKALIAMVGFTKTKVAEGMVDHAPELEAVRAYLRHNT